MPESFSEAFSHLALYRSADGSSEWLPCKVNYKFKFGEGAGTQVERIDGYGVTFERFPDSKKFF